MENVLGATNSGLLEIFPLLLDTVLSNTKMRDMEETNKWLAKVMQYNVPHGKLNRGLAVTEAYRRLTNELCPENLNLSYVAGWCLEILQAGFLIGDDIMDGSEMRRGKPCWYKMENNGVAAFNDTILLENVVYEIVKLYFGNQPYYVDLVETFHETVLKTAYGQSLDTRTSLENNTDAFTLNLYKKIVKYKTSYYSFYTPIKIALTMAGITETKIFTAAEKLCLKIGYLFQVQDDYLDCFGDSEITGKIGTDIQEGKCTWLFVTAMENADLNGKCLLKALYGAKKVEDVKKMYIELGVIEAYLDFEKTLYNRILRKIETLPEIIPREIFLNLVQKVYGRNK